MIDKQGLYLDISSSDYLGDCCPTPSFTQSIAKILLEQSPLHAWYAHPKLNPDFRPDDDTRFDLGNVAHKLLLGRGKDFIIIDAEDWRTKAAQMARKDASVAGKIGVLGKQVARADKMVKAAREQLELRGLGDLFQPEHGDSEVVVAWQENRLWLRQMIDWLSKDRRIFADLKTTDMSVAPQNLGRMMVNAGWPIQAAMAERGLGAVDPLGYRRRYLFVVQETAPPYQLNVVEIGEAALTMGRKQLDHAAEIWSQCMCENVFPGYPIEVVTPEYPGWAEQQWLDREIHEAARERVPNDLIMAG